MYEGAAMTSALPFLPSPLAVVGASARAAAFSARRAGCKPLAADLFADEDLRRCCQSSRIERYPDELLDWLREVRPAAWMYAGALENHPALVDVMADVCPLWGNRGDVLRRVRSPWRLAEALREANLLFPETRRSPEGLPRDGSWLAKTYHGAGGSGVSVLSDRQGDGYRQEDKETRRQGDTDPAISSPRLPLSLSPPLVYQRRVAGTPCAAVYVAAGGAATLLGVVQQLVGDTWLGAGAFQYCGAIGPQPLDSRSLAVATRTGDVLAERFALAGLFGVDFMVDGGRVWTIEVNPRYTASVEIVELATGVRAVAAHANACLEGNLPNSAPPHDGRTYGKAILFAKHDVYVSAEFTAWAMEQARRDPWPLLADVPMPDTPIARGRPILTLLADGATHDEVRRQLQDRARDIENRLYAPQRVTEGTSP